MKNVQVKPLDNNTASIKDPQIAKSLCKTYLLFLRVSGLFAGNQLWFQSKINIYSTYVHFAYAITSILLLTFYAIIFTTNFWRAKHLDKATFFRCIGFEMFSSSIALFSIIMSTRLPCFLPRFLNKLKTYEEQYDFCSKNVSFTQRLSRFKWVLLFFLTAIAVSFNYVIMEFSSMGHIFYPTYGFIEFWRIFTVVLVFITQTIAMYQMSTCLILYVTLSYCAIAEFITMSNEIEDSTKEDIVHLEMSLEFFYQKHEVMCQLIESANECLKPYLLLVFAVYIPMSCLTLYAAILDDGSSETASITTLMISTSLIGIFSVLLVGGLVNAKVNNSRSH